MATEGAPDLIGILADGVGYDLLGDHGGAQEIVQRIPLLISIPGEIPSKNTDPTTTTEISRIISVRLKL